MKRSLDSYVRWRPARWVVGVVVAAFVIVASPLLAAYVVDWKQIWWALRALCAIVWECLYAWFTITGQVCKAVLSSDNRWFSARQDGA